MALAEQDLAQELARVELELLQLGGDPPDGPTHRRPAWMAKGACRDHPDVEFIPAVGGRPDPRCRPICDRCPVSGECLDFAAANPDLVGVFGRSWFRLVAPSGAGRERWRRISTPLPRPRKRRAA